MDFLFLSQAIPPSPFNDVSGSPSLWIKVIVTFVVALGVVFALSKTPSNLRGPLVAVFTFFAGGFYVLQWLWPRPIGREPGTLPLNFVERVGFTIEDAVPVVANTTQILTGLLLGLGVFSILRIHTRNLSKKGQDWPFSLILLLSMLAMAVVGLLDWRSRQGEAGPRIEASFENWTMVNQLRDLMFDGLLQQMEAAMFSIIAFFILSAAYRAFRVRSMEASILLVTALVVMLSFMGIVEFFWNIGVNYMSVPVLIGALVVGLAAGLAVGTRGGFEPKRFAGAALGFLALGFVVAIIISVMIQARTGANLAALPEPTNPGFLSNFRLTEISGWLRDNVQSSSLRALDFGIGVGGLAMALRIWLSLEKQGVG